MAAAKEIVLMTHAGDSGDGGKYRHVPGGSATMFHTMCGWCDCPGAERHPIAIEGAPDCPVCLEVVRQAVAYRKFT